MADLGGQTVFQYGRVRAQRGKHGIGDYRMTLGDIAPTHGELLALLAGVLKAERRYNHPGHLGPYMLWQLIATHEPLFAKSWEDIYELADGVDDEKDAIRRVV